jgi:hypothetical protein
MVGLLGAASSILGVLFRLSHHIGLFIVSEGLDRCKLFLRCLAARIADLGDDEEECGADD